MISRLLGLVMLAGVASCSSHPFSAGQPVIMPASVSTVAFGSCADEDKDQPIWDAVNAIEPDVFVFLGDNVYADTADEAKIRASYGKLAAKPGYAKLRQSKTAILATWDDHDYGKNDGGKEFEGKDAARRAMLDFFGEPADSPRRKRDGIYESYLFGPEGQRVQIIVLDTRFNRDELRGDAAYQVKGEDGPYFAGGGGDGTILGEAQWRWLEKQLRQPADVRLIASSIQFVADDHGWEKWANFAGERQRMLDLIDETDANGVIFLSGDRHICELTCLPAESEDDEQAEETQGIDYPLYDITSSGLTNVYHAAARRAGRLRVGEAFAQQHYGLIRIDWASRTLRIQTLDVKNQPLIDHTVNLATLVDD